MTDTIKEAVRDRYAKAALDISSTSIGCCGPEGELQSVETGSGFGSELYEAIDTDGVPDEAVMGSLGCGNPTAIAALEPGQRVLDLGSGGGIDVFLAAKAVGPTGKAIGLDMTDEMLELASRNLAKTELENVEFVKGEMESIPLPDDSVDVIISNCVVNLSPDKDAVFREAHRVLAPGGRFAVSDIIATRELTAEEQADMASWSGCVAGALTQDRFEAGLREAGFGEISVEVTHEVGTDAVSALITAVA